MSLQPADPDPPPVVPGFAVRRLLGRGGHGQVWLATDLSCGSDVALKLASGGSTDADLAWEREVALLRRIDHPHVVRLRRVATVSGGGRALVLDLAPGGSLAALVERRGRLDPCEVTTVLVPLARALVHLHERGLVHGDISPGNILFSADGRPMLSDLGAARVLGLGEREAWAAPGFEDPSGAAGYDPARDVWALGAIGWYALAGAPPVLPGPSGPDPADVPDALLELLRGCLDPRPEARPGPAEVATRAWAAIPPAPIRLLHPPDELDSAAGALAVTRRVRVEAARAEAIQAASRRRRLTLRLTRRRWAWGALSACLLAAGTLLGAVLLHGAGSDPQPAKASAGEPSPDLLAAVQALGRARAAAFAVPSTRRLLEVDEPRSPAMAADAGLVRRLAARRTRLKGLTFAVSRVRQVGVGSRTVTLSLAVTTSAHFQVARGNPDVRVPASPARTVQLTLVRSPRAEHGWLVRSVG